MMNTAYCFASLIAWNIPIVAALAALSVLALITLIVCLYFFGTWFQAYMSGADITMLSLIGMSFRQADPTKIVIAKIMSTQAGLSIDRESGITTALLEAHALAGGDVTRVVRAIIVAHRAGIALDFDRAAAIELAGRDVLEAVRTSVAPRVIDCPNPQYGGKATISAVARDGVELCVHARVTVRTDLSQLVGGATEETVIARVGQGIIAAIGAAITHMDVMEMPDRISKNVLAKGLDSNTAYEIVSIDIADIGVGENIGARLQREQAEADTRTARARAEQRRAEAVAYEQEMKASVAASQAAVVLAESTVPQAVANAFCDGQLRVCRPPGTRNTRLRDPQRDSYCTQDWRLPAAI